MSIETREALGARIRELRKANNLSQQKLALMVNVERSYLAKLERGKRNPSIDCIEKIAGGLGVSLSELFYEIGPEGVSAWTPGGNADLPAATTDYFAINLPHA